MSVSTTLLSRALNAASWGYAGTVIKLIIQVGVQVVLARLLGPLEYGLFAIGVIVISFGLYFCDVTSSALIARQVINNDEIRFAFTWQLIISFLVSTVLFLFAHGFAIFVNEPRAETVIQILSLICIFNAIGGVSLPLLRHNLNFKSIQIAQVTGYFVGYVLIALPYAIFVTPSVNALLLAWLVQVLVTSVIYLYSAPHSWNPLFNCKASSELIQFGRSSLIANLGTWALTNADKVIVARFFPVATVGLYSTSANLMSTPLSQIYATFQQVAFSASAKLSTHDSVGRVFASIASVVVVFAGLAYVFSLTTADTLVAVLYGDKWKAAVPFIQAFSVTMFFHAVSGAVTPFLWAHGAISKDAKIQAGMAIVVAGGAVVMSSWTAVAVAWWVAGVFGVRALILLWVGSRLFPTSRLLLADALFRSLVFLMGAGVVFFVANDFMLLQEISISKKLLINLSILIFCLLWLIRYRRLIGSSFSDVIDMPITKILTKVRSKFYAS